MNPARTMLLTLGSLLFACTAAPNPEPPAEPATWSPPPRAGAPREAEAGAAASAAAAPAPAEPALLLAGAQQAPGAQAQEQPQSTTSSEGKPAATRAPADDTVIALVGGQKVHVGELLAQWLHHASPDVLEELDQVVFSRLVLLEASRLGIRVEPEQVESAHQAAVAGLEKEIGRSRPGVTLDEYVRRVLDLDPPTYRARMRENALRGLLAERAFRTWTLTEKHALARMIVVRKQSEADEVKALLDGGAPFEDVARSRSVDAEPERRGELVPVVESDTLMARLAFQTEIGSYTGPVEEQGAFVFVQVVERPEPLVGSWPELRERVEASLKEREPSDAEVAQWKASMLRRYAVDLGPFLRLAGEPAKRRNP